MIPARSPLAAAGLLLLAACGADDQEPDPRGVTARVARELNEAAAMLDDNSVAAEAVQDQP